MQHNWSWIFTQARSACLIAHLCVYVYVHLHASYIKMWTTDLWTFVNLNLINIGLSTIWWRTVTVEMIKLFHTDTHRLIRLWITHTVQYKYIYKYKYAAIMTLKLWNSLLLYHCMINRTKSCITNFFLHLLRGESLCAECSSSHYIVHVVL